MATRAGVFDKLRNPMQYHPATLLYQAGKAVKKEVKSQLARHSQENKAETEAPAKGRSLSKTWNTMLGKSTSVQETENVVPSKHPTSTVIGTQGGKPVRLRFQLDKESVHIFFRSSPREDHNLASYLQYQKKFDQPVKFDLSRGVGSVADNDYGFGAHAERQTSLSHIDLKDFKLPNKDAAFDKMVQDYQSDP
jgi:hypothetical protein